MNPLRERTDGEIIQVGDIILIDTQGFGKKKRKVTRVTAKYCFVAYNEKAEGKFPRLYNSFSFCELPKQAYSRVLYSVLTSSPGNI